MGYFFRRKIRVCFSYAGGQDGLSVPTVDAPENTFGIQYPETFDNAYGINYPELP